MPGVFDLSGVLRVQKDYINDLTAISNQNGNINSNISSLNTTLGNTFNNYLASFGTASDVLTKQKTVNGIIDAEKERLNAKKQQIDTALETQNRMIQLNESYRKRTAQYTYVTMVIILALLIYIVLVKLPGWVPIPEGIIDLLTVVLIFSTIIAVWKLVSAIGKRDLIDYDQLKLPGPKIPTEDEITKSKQASQNAGDISSIVNDGSCVGADCCDGNASVWNIGLNKCVKKCPTGQFDDNGTCVTACPSGKKECGSSCIASSATCYEFESFSGLEKANSAYEYNSYAPYK